MIPGLSVSICRTLLEFGSSQPRFSCLVNGNRSKTNVDETGRGFIVVWSHFNDRVTEPLCGAAVHVHHHRPLPGEESLDKWVYYCPDYRMKIFILTTLDYISIFKTDCCSSDDIAGFMYWWCYLAYHSRKEFTSIGIQWRPFLHLSSSTYHIQCRVSPVSVLYTVSGDHEITY